MTREAIPLAVADISAFSRSLARELSAAPLPGHLALMNMLARAGGWRNFQHLRASAMAGERLVAPATAPDPADLALVRRVLVHFDGRARLVRWPSRRSVQILCLWALWSQLPPGPIGTEQRINEALNARHLFGDPATLRRDMVALGLLSRRPDGSDYRRNERPPSATARALISALAARA